MSEKQKRQEFIWEKNEKQRAIQKVTAKEEKK